MRPLLALLAIAACDGGEPTPDADLSMLHSCVYYGCAEQPIDRPCVQAGECSCHGERCSPGPLFCPEIGCSSSCSTSTCLCPNPNGDGSQLTCRP